ncbi:MAG: xylulokinase [Clostridia bacterium]
MKGRFVLGVDFGGGASKATLLSANGEVIATSIKEYHTYYPKNGWAEQRPEDFYNALIYNVSSILKDSGVSPEDIRAIALDAATHTAVLLDEKGESVRNVIHWTDRRSVKEAEYLKKNYNDMIMELSYNAPSALWTLPQLMWLRENEFENYNKISRIFFVKDYIRNRLTGDFVTDSIEAMGSMLVDAKENCWSKQLCNLAGINVSMLPEIVDPLDIAGHITDKAAKETGLSENTLVVVGSTDTVMEVYASGAIDVGYATVKLATAGRICPVTTAPQKSPLFFNYKHIVPGLWYPGTGTKSCASSYRWYRDVLGEYEILEGERQEKDAYFLLDKAAGAVAPGADGLFFHPYLLGEITPYLDDSLRGSFVGISSFHQKGHFNRAVLEGVAYSLKDCFEVIKQSGIGIHTASIIGGGAKSPLWSQIVADMLGIPLVKTKRSDSSLGSAMLAGVATGMFSTFADSTEKCVKVEKVIYPDATVNQIYEKGFITYKKIHDVLEKVYHTID